MNDGTGTASVDPEDAELLLTSGDEVTVAGGDEPPAFVREFHDREMNVAPVSRRRWRYQEVHIEVGDPVLVAGQATPEAVEGPGSRATTAITLEGDAPRFYVTADPDKGLGRRLVEEAFVSFPAPAILLAFACYLRSV